MHIHILGICGTFMGGIAAIARQAGHKVTGCDANVYPPMSTQLEAQGIELIEGFSEDQLSLKPDLFVIGNVVSRGNPLMEAILNEGLPYISGPQWLGEQVLSKHHVLAVAGTHGKTTTTAMLTWILEVNGLTPGYLIGGVPNNFDVSARLGKKPEQHKRPFFVIEADEYDTAFFDKRSKFVHYRASTAILNNLEFDHADIFPDLAAIQTQFHHLVRTVPGQGRLIVNGEDPHLETVLAKGAWTPVDTFAEQGRAQEVHQELTWALESLPHDGFKVLHKGQAIAEVHWDKDAYIAGRHNQLNALAAIAAAHHVGVSITNAAKALGTFKNVKRRLELVGKVRDISVYDDFAHHPTAITTTVDGLRRRIGRARLIAVLEPRSNTMKLGVMKTQLPDSLKDADFVFGYGALEGKDALGWDLAESLGPLGEKACAFNQIDELVKAVVSKVQPGDHILVMSNGGFGGVHQKLLKALASMHFLYEEGGEVKVATLLGAAPAQAESWQVETLFGKRIKLKAKDVWMTFKDVDPNVLLTEATELSQQVDMDLLWECSPDEEFKFDQIAREYFGDSVNTTQLTALAIALQSAPIYFRRKGRGHFQRAPQEQLKAALLAVERKKAEGQQQAQWEDELLAGKMPDVLMPMVSQLLYAPDKNGIHYKALNAASQKMGLSIAALLLKVGALASPLAVHQGHFLKEHFPKGIDFDAALLKHEALDLKELTTAAVQAFSIDDAQTTEIDDAFSVTQLSDGYYQVGIHIAAPGLGIARGDALDGVARKRLSTVYFPGGKITMLPSGFVEQFSLSAASSGEMVARPALSLYVYINSEGQVSELEGHAPHTKVELVPMRANLRLHEIEDKVTEETLLDPSNQKDIPFQKELSILWQAAKIFHANRQIKRVEFGQRPEVLGVQDPKALLRDFHFEVLNNGLNLAAAENASIDPFSNTVDDSAWQIQITPRQRGSVIDSIVAEWMIFCNSTWGSLLAAQDVPAIYRAQQGWGAQRTRMQTSPCRHEGLGVENYAWCTSPLRRYSDLVNQWQLIALARFGVTAKLAAPFAPKDSELLAIAADFDTTYGSYGEYQNQMEKYWCLRWVIQQGLPFKARVRTLKEGQVRLEQVPLRLFIPELADKSRGLEVEVEIMDVHLLELTASVRVLEIFEEANNVVDAAD